MVAVRWAKASERRDDAGSEQRIGPRRAGHHRYAAALREVLEPEGQRTVENDDWTVRTIGPIPRKPVLPQHADPAGGGVAVCMESDPDLASHALGLGPAQAGDVADEGWAVEVGNGQVGHLATEPEHHDS